MRFMKYVVINSRTDAVYTYEESLEEAKKTVAREKKQVLDIYKLVENE